MLKRRLFEKTVDPRWQAKEPRKEQQKMQNRIDSSAYHAEKNVCIASEMPADEAAKRGRAAGQKAVKKWMASVKG